MKSPEDLEVEAIPGSPFSNSDYALRWLSFNCARCAHDQDFDQGGCPLIVLALTGYTPTQWTPEGENGNWYKCKEQTLDDATP